MSNNELNIVTLNYMFNKTRTEIEKSPDKIKNNS